MSSHRSSNALTLAALKTNAVTEIYPGEPFGPQECETVIPNRAALEAGYYWIPRELRPVTIHSMADVTYTSRAHLSKNNEAIKDGNIYPLWEQKNAVVVSDGTKTLPNVKCGFLLLHPNFTTYGHLLLEMIPKLLVYKKLAAVNLDLPIVLPSRVPDVVNQWIQFFCPGAPVIVLDQGVPTEIAEALLADMLVTHYACGYPMKEFVRECLERADGPQSNDDKPQERIYISRRTRREGRPDFRTLGNFEEVQARAIDLGFSIIEPERLDLSAQIRAFANAKIIVGETSSALHNAMFSPPDTVVVQFNPFTRVQRQLALSLGHRLVSIVPDDGTVRRWPAVPGLDPSFSIKPNTVETAIEAALNAQRGDA